MREENRRRGSRSPARRGDYGAWQGASGPDTIRALSELGYIYSLNGDAAKALQRYRDIYQRTLARSSDQEA